MSGESACAVEVGQPVSAGDQNEALGGSGQQRPYMLGVGGVFQHDQDRPAGKLRTPQRGPLRFAQRDVIRRYAQLAEQGM